jgi:hypothetical protein
MFVRLWEVRGQRHDGRLDGDSSRRGWEAGIAGMRRSRGGMRVLAAHDHVGWDVGLVLVSIGRERPDARVGATSRAVSVEGWIL